MDQPKDLATSLLRKHAADALRRARKLPVGHARNDLRQLAMGLLWLDRNGKQAKVQDSLGASTELTAARIAEQ
jgi:hypothetical protein